MNSFEHRSCLKFAHILLGSCALLALPFAGAQAQDRQIVNEPGGIGVQQSEHQVTGTPNGALVMFRDDRTGNYEYRIRSTDSFGNPSPSSISVEALLEPESGFSSPTLTSNNTTGASALNWYTWTGNGYSYKAVAVDHLTGEPIGEPTVVESFDRLFISDMGDYLFLESVDATLEGQFHDSDFNPIGPALILADDSKLDFPNGINRYDVAFAPDGSFVVTWIGMFPPYFDQVKSRLFNADGYPAGPINEHTDVEGLFGIVSKVEVHHGGTALVTWASPDGYMGQVLDTDGIITGDPVVMYEPDSGFEDPEIITTTNYEDNWVAVSENGIASFDLETLMMTDSLTWTNSSSSSSVQMAWIPGNEYAVAAWKDVDESDGDSDIMGMLHQLHLGSSDIGHLSDDVDGAYQTYPSAASNDNGRSAIAWLDKRMSADGHIAFQVYDANGEKDGANRFLSTPGRKVYSPQVSMNDSGAFLIAWIDIGAQDLYGLKSLRAQRFDAAAQQVGSPITIYTESNSLLAPIFGGVWNTQYNKRTLLLLDNGSFFATWGLKIVTGGTIGNPTYGRTDLFTKAFSANNSWFTASTNQKLAGAAHGLVPSGSNSAQVLYYGTSGERLRMLEFSADGSPSYDAPFPEVPDFGADFGDATHVDFIRDADSFSITWSASNQTDGDRAYTAHYDADGDLLASDSLEHESTFSCMRIAPDGIRMVLHGTSSELYYKQYDPMGTALGESVPVSAGEAYDINSSGLPEFEMLLLGEQIRLSRHIDSGTDQAKEIELSSYDIDPVTCNPADFNCDGAVNGFDLAHLLGYWGLEGGDVNDDGNTDGADLAQLLGAWNQ